MSEKIHSSTFQADLCNRVTPATVAIWLMRRATEQHGLRNDDAWRALVMAGGAVERYLLDDAEAPTGTPAPAAVAP